MCVHIIFTWYYYVISLVYPLIDLVSFQNYCRLIYYPN